MSTRRRSLRRIVVRVMVFLVLGTMVNVASAWASVVFVQPDGVGEIGWVYEPDEIVWCFFVHDDVGIFHVTSFRSRREVDIIFEDVEGISAQVPVQTAYGTSPSEIPAYMNLQVGLNPIETSRRTKEHRIADARGWPMLALWSHWIVPTVRTTTRGEWAARIEGGLVLPTSTWPYSYWPVVFPSRPIWPGFAINTFFYAAILWPLFAAPGRVRRWRRIRRGLCAKCAYPVGASEVCTECGHVHMQSA